jgi:o-succinylbenzoate synthase
VKIARARLIPFSLPLRKPLRTARGVSFERCGVLVELEMPDGRLGYGEATPVESLGRGDLGACLSVAIRLSEALIADGRRGAESVCAQFSRRADDVPAARFGVETALLDLDAQLRGVRAADVLAESFPVREAVPVNALLSGVLPDVLAEEASRAVAEGFETLKLKVASDPPDVDRARVAAVRAAAGPEIAVRIDANGGWTPEAAIHALQLLDACELELVEQPVAPSDIAGLARVRSAVLVPVAADESLAVRADAQRVIDGGAADLLVLKPAVIGGLRPSLSLARRGRARGLRAFATTALDGVIARAAALALAAALPEPMPACGLATGAWLADDFGRGPAPVEGWLELSPAPGLGVQIEPAALRRLALGSPYEITHS